MKNIKKIIKELYVLYFLLGKNQRKWLLFLKNNPDKQHKNTLGVKLESGSEKTCCLGQAGLMFGYCTWDGSILRNTKGEIYLPTCDDNQKFLKLRDERGNNSNYGYGYSKSLSFINDSGTWLDVYNACINDPKGYFTGKI